MLVIKYVVATTSAGCLVAGKNIRKNIKIKQEKKKKKKRKTQLVTEVGAWALKWAHLGSST